MFAIGIRYLMGWAAATDIAKRNPPEEPEWPVHPGRVFMALAAAHFETPWDERHDAEQQALEWLETQLPPELVIPRGEPRSPVTCYVPVNDQQGLGSLPTQRSKQARTFPRVILDDEIVYLVWPNTVVPESHRGPLDFVCRKVTRIGHSSSVVQVWSEFDRDVTEFESSERQFIPQRWVRSSDYERLLRVPTSGTLANLRRWYNAGAIDAWADLHIRLQSAKGKEKKTLKAQIEERFGNRMPGSQRPILRATEGYSQWQPPSDERVCETVFDDKLLILSKVDGPNLGLESTVQLMTALRGTILNQFSSEAATPAWISGHDSDGKPLREPHLALIPLAYVGSQYADGHLLGAALAFPRCVPPRDRAEPLRSLFIVDDDGSLRLPLLKLGPLGEWTIARETRQFPAQALRPETWTAPGKVWGTVTPIVLDRYPKSDRLEDRKTWVLEVAHIIASSCQNIGLPEPIEIDVEKSSWHRGAPRAMPGKMGFPLFPIRSGQPCRVQVHAWLRFAQPVHGPVILGAGRYLGYGLCKPLQVRTVDGVSSGDGA
jgi:CRISPR-associated protein Csb2